MDIAFVTSQVYPFRKGGTEKRVHEIGRRLARRDHDVTVYGCKWWSGPDEIERDGMTLRGVCEPGDQYTNGRRSIIEALRFSGALAGPLLENRDTHELVVACVSEHFPVWVSTVVSLVGDASLVTTWHELWDHEYWSEYLGQLGTLGWVVQSVTANVSQRPVAVSSQTANRLERLSLGDRPVDIVPNGVDIDYIRGCESATDGFDVLFVGRLIPEKNVGMLLSAFDEVATDHDVTLGIIGDGPERDSLREQAAGMTHSDRVSFLGFLEEDSAVYEHMAAADVFALPSVREGFGITVLESMAAGCVPVVVSHPDSAATDVVGDCGYVADPTVESVARHLARALTGGSSSEPLERARTFSWDRVAREAERVYDKAGTVHA